MTSEMPSLRKDIDYKGLEDGIRQLQSMIINERADGYDFVERARDELQDRAAQIEGVVRVRQRTLYDSHPVPSVFTFGGVVEHTEARDAFYRLFAEWNAAYRDAVRGYNDRIVEMDKRLDKFKAALIGMTKIEALTEIKRDPEKLRLYLALGSSLFNFNIDFGYRAIGIDPDGVTQERLFDPAFGQECRKKGGEDVYRVSNPSSKVPFNVVTRHVLAEVIKIVSRKYGDAPIRFSKGIELAHESLPFEWMSDYNSIWFPGSK